MAKIKWTPCEAMGIEIPVGKLLTLVRNDGKLKVDLHPSWGAERCIAYAEILPSSKDPEGWMYEHHGEDPPRKDWYLVTTEKGRGYGQRIEKAFWDDAKCRWFRNADCPEVVAWREIPKPYGRRK
jgi:hypothetical protein